MSTFTALTTLNAKHRAEALGEALENLSPEPTGVGVFELEDGSGLWEVGAYFEAPPDDIALALLAAAHDAKDFAVSELPEVDWVAKVKRELSPVIAGRFFVYGSHDADRVPADCIPLLIEASMAFGTGHHGTTKGCLLALDQLVDCGVRAQSVLDLGCGTAVLAMAAAKIWPAAAVSASDIDPVAVDVAEANLVANNMKGRIDCIFAEGLDHSDLVQAKPFDLVFANILKAPLIALSGEITAAMKESGHVILSGILNEQADEVCTVYQRHGNSLISRIEIGDWTTIILSKSV